VYAAPIFRLAVAPPRAARHERQWSWEAPEEDGQEAECRTMRRAEMLSGFLG
jgi:hypothetical protein